MEQVYRRKKNILKAELEQAPSGQARDEISLGMEHLGHILKLGPQTSSGGHVRYVQVKRWGLGWHWGEGSEQCSGSKRARCGQQTDWPNQARGKHVAKEEMEERG